MSDAKGVRLKSEWLFLCALCLPRFSGDASVRKFCDLFDSPLCIKGRSFGLRAQRADTKTEGFIFSHYKSNPPLEGE